MRQTLFFFPREVAGWPVFGFGLLLAMWTVVCVGVLCWQIRKQGFSAETRGYLPMMALVGAAIAWLLPAVVGQEEGLPIRGFGVMLLLAVLAGVGLATLLARRMGLDAETVYSLAVWLFVSGIVGARLFYIVQKWDEFQRGSWGETFAALLNVTQGGLVVYGSLLGAMLGLVGFCRVHRLPLLAVADLIAPSMLLGLALGRVGCLLNGCCYGDLSSCPWAVSFPWRSPPHVRQVQRGEVALHGIHLNPDLGGPATIVAVDPGSAAADAGLQAGDRLVAVQQQPVGSAEMAAHWILQQSQPGQPLALFIAGRQEPLVVAASDPLPRSRRIHPTQIYSTLDGLILCFFLWSWYPRRRRDGEVTAWMLTLYPITRILVEILRSDEQPIVLGLTISQAVSVLLLAVAALLWWYLLRQPAGVRFPLLPDDELPQSATRQPAAV